MNPEKRNSILIRVVQIAILCWLVAGFFHVKDYGISFDEGTEFNTTILTFQYAEVMLNHLLGGDMVDYTGFMEYPDNIYGAAIRFPLYLVAKHLPMEVRDFFLLSHYYTFLWFCIAVGALYYLGKELSKRREVGCVAALFLVLSPRIAAESVYNIKDALFMSVFLVAMAVGYYFLKSKKNTTLVWFCFFMALCINTRYIGGILLLLVVALWIYGECKDGKKLGKSVGKGIGICGLTYVFYYIMTPFLWTNPLGNTIKIVASFSNYADGVMRMLFMGEHYYSNELPWYYLSVWIAITTPLLILLLFMTELVRLGIKAVLKCLKYTKEDKGKEVKKENPEVGLERRYYHCMVGVLLLVLLLDIILNPIKYDGWRHFYFLYPILVIMASMGFWHMWNAVGTIKKESVHKLGKAAMLGALLLFCVAIIGWNWKVHPYEYVFFNCMTDSKAEQFERDYWYVSTYDALEEVLAMKPEGEINVYCVCKTVSLFLSEAQKARLCFANTIDEADYVIMQYRDATVEELKRLCEGMELVSERMVEGIPIYSIYYAQ